MASYKFGDIVKEVKINIDRNNNPYEFYVAGDHMDSEDLTIHRKGIFASDDVGPAFTRLFKPGQVLYGSRRTYLKKVAVADFEGICSNTTFVLEGKAPDKFDERLLPFIMLSDGFTQWSVSHSKGSTNPYILFSDLASYEFELPTMEKQRKLADKLWSAYHLKEAYQKLLSATDEMVKSQFIEQFGNAIQSVPLEDVVEILDNKRKPLNDSQRSGMKSGQLYPYYGATGVVDYVNAFLTDEDLICLAEDCGAYGPGEQSSYIIEGKAWVNNHAHVLRAKDNVILKYLQFFFTLTDLNEFISGTTRKKLTQSALKKIKVTLPDIELQELFVAIAEQADKSKFELKQAIEAIDQVIKSLINN